MLPLRFPWLWMIPGWILIAAVCVASLLPAGDLPRLGISDKIEHAGSYFLIMLWFAGVYPRSRYILIGIALFLLGLTLDMLQLGTATRQFDWFDVTANFTGIVIALVGSYVLFGGWCLRLERWLAPRGT